MVDDVDRLYDKATKDSDGTHAGDEESSSFTILKIKHNETNEELHVTGGSDVPIPHQNEVVGVGEANALGVEQHGPSYVVVERTFGYYELNMDDANGGIMTAVTLFVDPI
jgi:hypothetical protein